jgi:hypothetical protein
MSQFATEWRIDPYDRIRPFCGASAHDGNHEHMSPAARCEGATNAYWCKVWNSHLVTLHQHIPGGNASFDQTFSCHDLHVWLVNDRRMRIGRELPYGTTINRL